MNGKAARRTTTIAFHLAHGGSLVFTLEELSPACRKLSTFHARGRRGVNRIRFHARSGGKLAQPGTYRLVGKRPDGRVVLETKLVIVRGRKPSARKLAAARRANVCWSATQVVDEPGALSDGGAPAGGSGKNGQHAPALSRSAAPATPPAADRSSGGVLGVSTSLSPTPKKLPFLVLALVGLAILLFGVGALPRSLVPVAAAGAVVARRRLEIAATGVATLVASVIAYLLA